MTTHTDSSAGTVSNGVDLTPPIIDWFSGYGLVRFGAQFRLDGTMDIYCLVNTDPDSSRPIYRLYKDGAESEQCVDTGVTNGQGRRVFDIVGTERHQLHVCPDSDPRMRIVQTGGGIWIHPLGLEGFSLFFVEHIMRLRQPTIPVDHAVLRSLLRVANRYVVDDGRYHEDHATMLERLTAIDAGVTDEDCLVTHAPVWWFARLRQLLSLGNPRSADCLTGYLFGRHVLRPVTQLLNHMEARMQQPMEEVHPFQFGPPGKQ